MSVCGTYDSFYELWKYDVNNLVDIINSLPASMFIYINDFASGLSS